jgi:hypothetical protein
MTTQLTTNQATQAATTGQAAPATHGRLQTACHSVRLAVQEMNYATRRLVELQAPWSVDTQWHRK